MRSDQEIQDKIFELNKILNNNKNKNYLQFQIDILKWVLDESDVSFASTEELQKDGINIEFG